MSPEELVNSVVPFARRISKRMCPSGTCGAYTMDDFFQAAMLGAHIASLRYDPSKGFKFLTFAEFYMRGQAIELYQKCGNVHIPDYLVGKMPEEDRVKYMFHSLPLDAFAFSDSVETLGERLLTNTEEEKDSQVNLQKAQLVRQAMEPLNARERKVVMASCGMIAQTKADIAKENGVTRQAEEERWKKSLAKIRKHFAKRHIYREDFWFVEA